MSIKQQLWHTRMGAVLESHRLAAKLEWEASNEVDIADGFENSDYRAQAFDTNFRMQTLRESLPEAAMDYGVAEELHAALAERIAAAGPAPLGIIEETALARLGMALECSPIAEYLYNYQGSFESGNITFTGPFERLRQRLRVGVSLQENAAWMFDTRFSGRVSLKDVNVSDLSYERAPAVSDMDLQLVRVSGIVRFTLVVHSEEEPLIAELLEQVRVALDPSQAPAPVQRAPLQGAQLIGMQLR